MLDEQCGGQRAKIVSDRPLDPHSISNHDDTHKAESFLTLVYPCLPLSSGRRLLNLSNDAAPVANSCHGTRACLFHSDIAPPDPHSNGFAGGSKEH